MRSLAPFVIAVLASGCGAATGLDAFGATGGGSGGAGTASSGAGGHTAELEPAPCRVTDTWTVYADGENAYAAAVAQNGDSIGILFWEDDLAGPRELRLSEVPAGNPKVKSWASVTMSSAITQAGLVSHQGKLHASWVDEEGRVHVGTLSGMNMLAWDVVIGEGMGIVGATIGATSGGRFAAFWADTEASTTSLRFATSANGHEFDPASVVAMPGSASALSLAPAPGGVALAWSASIHEAEGSELHAAIADEKAAIEVPDETLTHHPMRYVYDVGIVRAPESLVIATTDSRADIGDVPLYSTTLGLDGTPGDSDTRLTYSGGHEKLDLVFDGASSVLGYDESEDPGSQVWVRQLDGAGHQLFQALQVSHAKYLESGCCTRTSDVKLATDADGRVTVFWSEGVAPPQGGSQATALQAARLDCAKRP